MESLAAGGGVVRQGFEPVRDAFEAMLARRPGFGASLCVYRGSESCVDLWGGGPYRHDSVQVLFSASKGATAICMSFLAQRGLLDLDAPVSSIWPEFANAGKENVIVRWLACHRAGVPTVDRPMGYEDWLDHDRVVEQLAAQKPYWKPGTAHGYHGISMGNLCAEIVRRVTGDSLGRFFASSVAEPLGLDLWIGLPEVIEERVLPVRMGDVSGTKRYREIEAAMNDPESIPYKVGNNPPFDVLVFNTRPYHAAELPAANGIGSARALARMYASCTTAVDGLRILDDTAVSDACRVHSDGFDLVTMENNRFGLGFYLPFSRIPFAGPTSFGHDGAGGALAFADRTSGMSFAFLTDLVPPQLGIDPEAQPLVAVAAQCVATAP